MADSKRTDSGSGKESQASEPCGNFEGMSKLMQKCCGGDDGSFDFRKMMEEMCCGKREEEAK
ncbi:hypothetical protein IH824_08960 [candidate division KSB1 bacterium]|nr:hypothetical protein [candidate division KSB1 bacterium]